jgi:CelD/BcsL family acetyltransferase involved in cellulose biosynthesis
MTRQKGIFYLDLFEGPGIPPVVQGLTLQIPEAHENDVVPFDKIPGSDPRSFYHLKLVQGYLNPLFDKEWAYFKLDTFQGFAICMQDYGSAEAYVNQNIKPRLRTALRSRSKRLEDQEAIYEKMYYGSIDPNTYSALMSRLKEMIEQRFNQLGQSHQRMNEWEQITESFYHLINSRKASMFAIYSGDNPIAISLNRHLGMIFSYAIPSFDISYSRYSLGHLLIQKQLRWCFENNYKIFDMGLGYLRYKKDWCNHPYSYASYLVYKRSYFPSKIRAYLHLQILLLKRFLKAKGLHTSYHKFLKAFEILKK